MTVIASAPMPLPRLRLGAATGQTAVTSPSPTVIATARPTYLVPPAFGPSVLFAAPHFQGQGLGSYGAFAPSVLYGAQTIQAQGMGRYGRRTRLAGVERFAPSVLYGAYNMGAQGLGRYRSLVRPIRMGCCGSVRSRYAGYPVKRLGQNIFSDIASLFTPTPGGGSVTVGGQTQYVNAQGVDQSTPDASAGQSLFTNPGAVLGYDASGLATAAASSLTSGMPWWGWALLVGGGGLLAYKVLK